MLWTPTHSALEKTVTEKKRGRAGLSLIVPLSMPEPPFFFFQVSPIDYGHILLIPRILDHIPQCMDASALLLALRFTAEIDNPCFRLGYNSLGAFATVNHLHFQVCLPLPLPCFKKPRIPWNSGNILALILEA